MLAIHGDKMTYVIRSLYTGSTDEFAWVLPVPATPTDVVALTDDQLFKALDGRTRPTFESDRAETGGAEGAARLLDRGHGRADRLGRSDRGRRPGRRL